MSKLSLEHIEKLASICRDEETNILMGRRQICVNVSLLDLINHSQHHTNSAVVYVKHLFAKCPAIKIVGELTDATTGAVSDAANDAICMRPFVACVSLELSRVSMSRLIVFDSIRSQLKSLTCIKAFETPTVDQSFWHLFGVWPLLKHLKLCHNITSVNASLIPSSVQTLDLSWNRIEMFTNVCDYSVNSITKLDLSYNAFKCLPQLNNITCATLQCLYMRSNMIESLSGIEKLVSLCELDIAYNCLMDAKLMTSLISQCKSIQLLWVEGNPFCCDKNVNHFIKRELPYLTHLDGIKFNICDINDRINEDKMANDLSTKVKNEELLTESYDSIAESTSNRNISKRKKYRIAEIIDSNEINGGNEAIASNHSSQANYEQSLNITKEMIKQKRQQFGSEWLVTLKSSIDQNIPQSTVNIDLTSASKTTEFNDINDFDLIISQAVAESTPKSELLKHSESNLNDDDIEILPKEHIKWNSEELENDCNIFIVDSLDIHQTVFVYVRQDNGMLFEKDCVTGKILRTHDLKVITDTQIIENNVLKILFDSKVNSKCELLYQFDSLDSCNFFIDNFLNHWITQRQKQQNSNEVNYECLRCGLNRMSEISLTNCPNCNSDAIMLSDKERRRSGSDITILSHLPHSAQQLASDTSRKPNAIPSSVLTNPFDQICLMRANYGSQYFTNIDHRLKLFIEVEIFTDSLEGGEEVAEAILKCKSITHLSNNLESSLLIISNKKIYICSFPDSELDISENFAPHVKIIFSSSLSSLIGIKHLPNLLRNQGFLFEFNCDNKSEKSFKPKSFISRYKFSSKKSNSPEKNIMNFLIVADDQIIGSSFITFLCETICLVKHISNIEKEIFDENVQNYVSQNDLLTLHFIESAKYKRNDMKNYLKLNENSLIVADQQCVCLAKMSFDQNLDFRVQNLYKEFIINLLPPIYINIESKQFKLLFVDDLIETEFVINVTSINSMRAILEPIKSKWEQLFDIPLSSTKF